VRGYIFSETDVKVQHGSIDLRDCPRNLIRKCRIRASGEVLAMLRGRSNSVPRRSMVVIATARVGSQRAFGGIACGSVLSARNPMVVVSGPDEATITISTCWIVRARSRNR
jgi:hypothetical protein